MRLNLKTIGITLGVVLITYASALAQCTSTATWTLSASPNPVPNNGTVSIIANPSSVVNPGCPLAPGSITVFWNAGNCVTVSPASQTNSFPATATSFVVGTFTVTNICGDAPHDKRFTILEISGGHTAGLSTTVSVSHLEDGE